MARRKTITAAQHKRIYEVYVAAAKARHELKLRAAEREWTERAVRHEQRWGGVRSLLLLAAMSSVMVSLLVVGPLAH